MSVHSDRVFVLPRELSVSGLGSVGNLFAVEHHAEIFIGTSPAPVLEQKLENRCARCAAIEHLLFWAECGLAAALPAVLCGEGTS
ncbi:hypothetical protein I3J27_33395 [Bradyrhizobium xenonodulans]|uniref:Uncharacterized protein n=1 Tax=Bradyrhizobium xenonodulans TaxID=2736875 RepID=A0ABY7MHD1_9BRAD|nr:hypothetical protein [Bradyrhizobium xenonodulans]WBL77843.1 hypothetical protein I3J27_33395 [Bradyrhizobium xenonodulans]